MTITVLVVEDDFRVARIHGVFVEQAGGFTIVGSARSATEALELAERLAPDLALVDNYLPDRPGVELAADLKCDVIMVTADRSPNSIRAALNAGALNYVIKPFEARLLTSRLAAYARYRQLIDTREAELDQQAADRAMRALHEADRPPAQKGHSPVTAQLVADTLRRSATPLTATELAVQLGIGRGTAQRYLAALAEQSRASMTLRYGATGRPEHLYTYTDATTRPRTSGRP